MSKKTSKKIDLGDQGADAAPADERTVNGYVAENAEKWDRAVNGSIGAEGRLYGGVGKDASPETKLAEYDKLGGLITFGGRKVKTGSFHDFKTRKAVASPEPILLFRVDGEDVEIPVGEEVPLEVRAAETAGKRKADKAMKAQDEREKKAAAAKAKKAKPQVEDEE